MLKSLPLKKTEKLEVACMTGVKNKKQTPFLGSTENVIIPVYFLELGNPWPAHTRDYLIFCQWIRQKIQLGSFLQDPASTYFHVVFNMRNTTLCWKYTIY